MGESLDHLHCSFCRRNATVVAKLVGGPGVYICDECVQQCADILGGAPPRPFPRWDELDAEALVASLGPAAASLAAQEASLADQVAAARARGVTWQQVGEAFGVSRQAVQQRFGRST